jgi:hypothetical protein
VHVRLYHRIAPSDPDNVLIRIAGRNEKTFVDSLNRGKLSGTKTGTSSSFSLEIVRLF